MCSMPSLSDSWSEIISRRSTFKSLKMEAKIMILPLNNNSNNSRCTSIQKQNCKLRMISPKRSTNLSSSGSQRASPSCKVSWWKSFRMLWKRIQSRTPKVSPRRITWLPRQVSIGWETSSDGIERSGISSSSLKLNLCETRDSRGRAWKLHKIYICLKLVHFILFKIKLMIR
jgi:hypothetical protein